MRIAFVGPYNQNMEEIASRLALKRHEVFAYVSQKDFQNVFVHAGIRLKHLPDFSMPFLNNFWATLSAIFAGYDTVHFQGAEAANFAWLLKALHPSTKIVTTILQQNSKQEIKAFVACNFSDKVIVTNKVTRLALRKKYDTRATLIPLGRKDKHISNTDALAEFGLKSKKYILSVGKFCKDLHAHHLVEIFKQLEDTGKTTNNFKLVIFARNFVDSQYAKQLESLVGDRKNIVLIENENEEILQQLFSHAYLFVDATTVGSTKSTILEALSFGVPTLVSDVKKNTAVIGKNGFVFDIAAATALRDCLAYLLSRPEEVAKMGNQARQCFENEFGWDAIVKKTLEVYELTQRESSLCHPVRQLADQDLGYLK